MLYSEVPTEHVLLPAFLSPETWSSFLKLCRFILFSLPSLYSLILILEYECTDSYVPVHIDNRDWVYNFLDCSLLCILSQGVYNLVQAHIQTYMYTYIIHIYIHTVSVNNKISSGYLSYGSLGVKIPKLSVVGRTSVMSPRRHASVIFWPYEWWRNSFIILLCSVAHLALKWEGYPELP